MAPPVVRLSLAVGLSRHRPPRPPPPPTSTPSQPSPLLSTAPHTPLVGCSSQHLIRLLSVSLFRDQSLLLPPTAPSSYLTCYVLSVIQVSPSVAPRLHLLSRPSLPYLHALFRYARPFRLHFLISSSPHSPVHLSLSPLPLPLSISPICPFLRHQRPHTLAPRVESPSPPLLLLDSPPS